MARMSGMAAGEAPTDDSDDGPSVEIKPAATSAASIKDATSFIACLGLGSRQGQGYTPSPSCLAIGLGLGQGLGVRIRVRQHLLHHLLGHGRWRRRQQLSCHLCHGHLGHRRWRWQLWSPTLRSRSK